MNRRERLEAYYIARLGVSGIFVAAVTGDRPVMIGRDRETGAPLAELGTRRWRRFWCADDAKADAVVDELMTRAPAYRGGWLELGVDQAGKLALECGRDLGIPLTENKIVIERSIAIIAELDRRREAMNSTGEMRAINKAYRAYRDEQLRVGQRAIAYIDFVDHRLENVLDALAAELFRAA